MAISTEIYHLQPLPRYASEKPYTMRYVPEDEIPVSNVVREKHVISVKDMRPIIDTFTLDQNGFMVLNLPSKMAYEDYESHEEITNTYLPELESILSAQFPGSTVDFVSYLVMTSIDML